jgi:hypothetical protein
MLLRRILAYNISLLWSFGLWVTFRIYKHSAPLELKRLVAATPSCASVANNFRNRSTLSLWSGLGAGFRWRRGLCNLDGGAYRVPGGSCFCQRFVWAEES